MEYNYRIMLLFDAKNCLPPADGKTGKPITRKCDGRGIITTEAQKARIKKQLVRRKEKVLHFNYGEDYTIFKQIKANDEKVNHVEEEKKYVDVRLFGALDMAKKRPLKLPEL